MNSKEKVSLDWRAVCMMLVLGMAYFFSNFHRLSLSVIGDVIAADFGLTSLQLATLGSAIFYSYAVMQIPCGFIADRVSARKLITWSCIFAAAATLWFSYAGSFTGLVLARILTGAATALVYVPTLTVLRKRFGDRVYGTMTGIMVAMGQLGAVCASAPLKLMTDLFNWRVTFMAIGGVSVALAAGAWFLVSDPPAEPKAAQGGKPSGSWRAALSAGCLSVAFWFLLTGGTRLAFQSLWGGRYFTQGLGLDAGRSSVYLMMISVGCIVGSLVLGRVADWIGNIRTMVGSTLVFAALWLSFALLPEETPSAVLFLLCLLLGATGAGGFTVGFSCIRIFSGKENTGIVTGVNNCCVFMGSALFTQISGILMELSPSTEPGGQFTFLLTTFAILSLLAAAVVVWVNRKRLSL